jgi:POT family proton-dependent oligopeptide transporter|tara:strand:+ start:1980 stop:3440 length:1461 start_codon:yes stop_codon:yes gene_type:complete
MTNHHPKGLKVLFFTEMWERMSYYGMRGILVLFMTASIRDGGLDFNNASASAIYGIYAALVYLATLPGGWIGDNILGQKKTILYGGIIIMMGHLSLAIPNINSFYIGLVLVVLGTGLLKPNISALVGNLYEHNPALRQSGFTIFYMAINLGSVLGFFICGYLGENIGWHYGFGAAGIGMAFGLMQYIYNIKLLEKYGDKPFNKINIKTKNKYIKTIYSILIIIFLITISGLFGIWRINPIPLASVLTVIITAISLFYFFYIFTFGRLNKNEKKRITMIFVLFVGAALFWSGFDQAGSSFNIFAKEYTSRLIFGWEYPASWLQILNPMFVVILSPFMSYLWIYLGKRMLDPSLPFKFGVGLIFMAIGFIVIATGAQIALSEGLAGAQWLLITYLLHTIGELTLSPIGLSAISSLSPKKYIGQMMGVWFLASSLGAIIAGLISSRATDQGLNSMPSLFNQIAISASIFGLILIIIARPLHRWVFKDAT